MPYIKYFHSFLIILFLVLCSAQFDDNWKAKVDSNVLAKAENGAVLDFLIVLKEQKQLNKMPALKNKNEKGRYVFDQLHQLANRTQHELKQLLETQKVPYQSFYIVNAIYSKGNLTLIQQLAEREDVAQIQGNPQSRFEEPEFIPAPDAALRTDVEWGIDMISANEVWEMGIRGDGAVVGGQDTGYDWDHLALKEKYRGWNGSTVDHHYNWHDAIHEISLLHNDSIVAASNNRCGLDSPFPCDDTNHGTYTMGTMVGSDPDHLIGVAPEAKWVACRNMERGYGSPVTYIECFEWMMAPTDLNNKNSDPSKAPHVINNSWSCPTLEGCNENNWATMEMVVDHLKDAGIVVVVSAGNRGAEGCGSVSRPAAMFSNSFTIGATSEADTIAKFSSRGPVGIDGSGRMKPNVSAPGVNVKSSVPNDKYALGSGTSIAGPHVAGAVALIISANPDLAGQVEAIETLLESTADAKTAYQDCGDISGETIPNNTYGYGRIDVLAAVEKALAMKVSAEAKDGVAIIATPNPTVGPLHLELHNFKGESTFELFDVSGKLLLKDIWNLNIYDVRELSLRRLVPGIYFYRVRNDDQRAEGKVLKY